MVIKTKLEIGLIVGLGLLAGWTIFQPKPKPVITNPLPNTTVVTVPGPITEKIVTQYITDPAQAKLVESLLTENRKLHIQVGTLTSTIAQLDSKGGIGINGGTITEDTTNPVVQPNNEGTGSPDVSERSYEFKDFQLAAKFGEHSKGDPFFNYELKQSFSIVTTTGKGTNGGKLSIVKLYQTTPQGKAEISSVTTEIQTLDNPTKWWVSPRIQGGLSLQPGATSGAKSFVVAAQWLKRGRSVAAEDTTFAILSPGVVVGANGASLTILPISFNLGGIKHNPFTNLWVSPTVNLDKSVGVAITATF